MFHTVNDNATNTVHNNTDNIRYVSTYQEHTFEPTFCTANFYQVDNIFMLQKLQDPNFSQCSYWKLNKQ